MLKSYRITFFISLVLFSLYSKLNSTGFCFCWSCFFIVKYGYFSWLNLFSFHVYVYNIMYAIYYYCQKSIFLKSIVNILQTSLLSLIFGTNISVFFLTDVCITVTPLIHFCSVSHMTYVLNYYILIIQLK